MEQALVPFADLFNHKVAHLPREHEVWKQSEIEEELQEMESMIQLHDRSHPHGEERREEEEDMHSAEMVIFFL